jgi:hypothetical protein
MIQNPYMNQQTQALMDYQSTNPTAPTTSARVMPGMPQPVQSVGDSFQPNNRMGAPVNALADYYSKNPAGSPAPQPPQWGASPTPGPTGAPVTSQAPAWGSTPAPAPGQPQQGALPPGTDPRWGATPAPSGAPFADATNNAPTALSPQVQALLNNRQLRQ